MLKIKNPSTGKIRYVLLEDASILDVSTLSPEQLSQYNIQIEDVDITQKTQIKLSGISQNDLEHIKGR